MLAAAQQDTWAALTWHMATRHAAALHMTTPAIHHHRLLMTLDKHQLPVIHTVHTFTCVFVDMLHGTLLLFLVCHCE